jgi:hypothetical protein
MKKILLSLVLLLSLTLTVASAQSQSGLVPTISKIKIKSDKPLLYESRTQGKDTIYITIKRWVYDTSTSKYSAQVVDYIHLEKGYKVVNEKIKSFSKEEIDGLFTSLSNSILTSESYSSEVDKLLLQALLIDTKTNLLPDGKTVYGGAPNDWSLLSN